MHLGEPLPEGHSYLIKDKLFWIVDASGNIVDRLLWPKMKDGRRIYFSQFDGEMDAYNNRWVP